jgi:hypothetical protein
MLIFQDFWLANPQDGENPAPQRVPYFIETTKKDFILKLRGYASNFLWFGRNEGVPPKEIDDALEHHTVQLDGTRTYINSSADYVVSGRGPYSVQDPKWYFENTNSSFHTERGLPSVPAYDTLIKFLGPNPWPISEIWALHDHCSYSAMRMKEYHEKLQNLYGTYDDLRTFSKKAQLIQYENYKAVFESVFVHQTQGNLLWMSHPAQYSVVWQTYSYDKDCAGAYFGCKKGCQVLNAIFDASTNQIVAVNSGSQDFQQLKIILKIYNLEGKLTYNKTFDVDSLVSNSVRNITSLNFLGNLSDFPPVVFVVTEVHDSLSNLLANNDYWTNVGNYQNYLSYFNNLSQVSIYGRVERSENKFKVYLINDGNVPAVQVRLLVLTETGKQVLPVYFSDNYVFIPPGEQKEIMVEFVSADDVHFEVEAFNSERVILKKIPS